MKFCQISNLKTPHRLYMYKIQRWLYTSKVKGEDCIVKQDYGRTSDVYETTFTEKLTRKISCG